MPTNTADIAAVMATIRRQDIPYSSLIISTTYQARAATEDQDLPALAATIRAIGLLQNLVVTEGADGLYEVCAGGRRFAALGLLVADDEFPRDHPVPCIIIPVEHAHLASLVENDARKAMHPADVYTAYARLRTDGMSVSAIAAAHGASEAAVRKLLALGNVSPKIMMLFRDDKISLDEIRALASVDDHARQEAAWAAAKSMWGHRPTDIRRLLAELEIRGDRPIARYLTAAAYQKAGGVIRRDLFGEGPSSTFFTDPTLVEQLAVEKLKRSKAAKAVEKEGLAWVEYRTSINYEQRKEFGEVKARRRELTPEEDQRMSAAILALSQAEAILEEIEEADDFDHDAHQRADQHVDACQAALRKLEVSFEAYAPELLPYIGAIVYIDHHGEAAVERGLVRREDRQAVATTLSASTTTYEDAGVNLPPAQTRPVHSAALGAKLQAEKTIALQAELMGRPQLALAMLIEKLIVDQAPMSGYGLTSAALDIRGSASAFELKQAHPDIVGTKAWAAVVECETELKSKWPDDRTQLMTWLLEQSQADLLELLALLVAKTVFRHIQHASNDQGTHLNGLIAAVKLDMADWWQPTASGYFLHVSKDHTLEVIRTVKGDAATEGLEKLKKAELATAAEGILANSRWLPEPLRIPTSNANA